MSTGTRGAEPGWVIHNEIDPGTASDPSLGTEPDKTQRLEFVAH